MIKFVSEEMLLEIKNNQAVLFHDVISKKHKLEEVFHNDHIIRETNIVGEDFVLDMSAANAEDTDLENVKRVHKYLSGLSESQASDERIWAAYTLSVFADYMKYRWPCSTEEKMMNHYFFSYGPKRSLFRNGIARLWWIGHLTYDPHSDGNKYELTEYVCSKQDHINLLLDIGFGGNPDIARAVIRVLSDNQKMGISIDRDIVRAVSQYVNTLGGIYLIDAMTYDEVYKKVQAKLKVLTRTA